MLRFASESESELKQILKVAKILVVEENLWRVNSAVFGVIASGDYRIIAEIQDDKIIIFVINVDKRNDIYK